MKFDFNELENTRKDILKSIECTEKFLYDKGIFLDLKSHNFSTKANSLKELKIAAIMDEFTLHCYKPECRLLEVSPGNFEQELNSFQPDMLFIESAWNGNHGLWTGKLAHGSKEYFALASYCKKRMIPIVFWNKEDPFHFEDFLLIAKTADFIFTTDSDMIPLYQSCVKSEKVYHLHFAAQPKLHNPIEIGQRQDKYCFAGAYYRCYPERADIFDCFSQFFLSTRGLAIYDREYGKKRSAYRFPAKYKPYILGNLRADEIEKAYKGYVFGINMNTVTSSSTMFARRVFELMASNTVTVGNFAKGLYNYFGELTICAKDINDLRNKIEKYCSSEINIHKYRLLGLRKVLTSHLYEDRLSDVVNKVFGSNLKSELPCILVIAQVHNDKEYEWILEEFQSQTYEKRKLFLFYGSKACRIEMGGSEPVIVDCKQEDNKQTFADILKSGYVAYFHYKDYYAANYLYDLVYSLRYQDTPIIGKNAFYYMEGNIMNYHKGELYSRGQCAVPRRSIINVNLISQMSIRDFLLLENVEGAVLYTDEWNYCENTCCNGCREIEDMALS